MSITELKKYLIDLVGQVTFYYNGYSCGIDPLAADLFEVWCGDNEETIDSIDEVMDETLFDGRSLKDIWDDVTDVEF